MFRINLVKMRLPSEKKQERKLLVKYSIQRPSPRPNPLKKSSLLDRGPIGQSIPLLLAHSPLDI